MVSIQTRRFRILLLYAVCLLPAVVWGANAALHSQKNSPFEWVPTSFTPRQGYEEFRRDFGSGEVLIVSWPGCTVDSADLQLLSIILRRDDFFHSDADESYVDEVITGQEVLNALIGSPLNLSREDAIARIQGTLIGPDGKATCAIIMLSPEGLIHRSEVARTLRDVLAQYCNVPASDQRFAGPVIDGLSVDEASDQSLSYFAIPSAIAAFLICWWWLRWLPGALLVLAVSVFCELATISLIYWLGGEMSALLVVLPPLIQVVTASGGIHLINYYLVARQSYEAEEAAWGSLKIGWIPCTLSAITTAIGLGSLIVSQLSPVRTFGLFGALGVAITLGGVLTFVPGVLALWKPKGLVRRATINLEDGSFFGEVPFWTWLSKFVGRYHLAIVLVSILLMIGLGWGIQWLKTSVHLRTLFPADSRILDDYAWIEEHVAPLAPVEVVLGFDKNCPLSEVDQFNLVGQVQDVLDRIEPIKGTMSVANLMLNMPADVEPTSREYRDFLAEILIQGRPHFTAAHFMSDSQSQRKWRVSAYVSALAAIDYADLIETIRTQLRTVGAANQQIAGITVQVTGVMPLVYEIQRALMQDL
ncbi:MAG: MMPL family transporter, partial [Planctomycetota bacterium]|nr:MMPL family transporter [Planctomycetota bacterium]